MTTSPEFQAWVDKAKTVDLTTVLDKRGIKLTESHGELVGPCPICGGNDRFAVKKQLFNCRGCGKGGKGPIDFVMFLDGLSEKAGFLKAVETLTESPPPKDDGKINGRAKSGNGAAKPYSPTIAKYTYRQADGTPYLQVHRLADKSGFPQYRWSGEIWVKGKPEGPKIPYRLPELVKTAPGTRIWICEGEKDADNLAKLGFVASCNSEGAEEGSGKKFTADLIPYFKDHHVFVLEDNDAKGRKHAAYVARVLDPVAASVRIVRLPGLPEKGDVSDWLKHDTAGARLIKEADSAPPWEPTADDGHDHGGDHDSDDDELIVELAALPALAYAKRRVPAAKKIGITVSELDKIVAEARGEPEPEAFDERWLVEPWEEEVVTADLLTDLQAIYNKHVILPDDGAAAMALWTLHAWTIDASYVSPFLMFTSPTPRCGKTIGMALLLRTGPRTILTSNISSAAVFRFIEAHHPTLIIDEADSFVRDNEDMRGILNSGHTRDGAFVVRCEGDDNEPKKFSTWAPKAVAGIGKLAATLRDRAIILPMKRKRPGEQVTKLRVKDSEDFMTLRRKASRWANDNLEALRNARPAIPEALNDRAQDNWEPLLAIADLAGGDWPNKARASAMALSKEADGEADPSQLLVDIQNVFISRDLQKITTKSLISSLAEDETKPWGSYTKDGKPITPDRLARLLWEFEIKPRTIKIAADATARGYLRGQFEEAWERYAPASAPASPGGVGSQPDTPTPPSEINYLHPVQPVTRVTAGNDPNPLKINKSVGVSGSDLTPTQIERRDEPDGAHVCAQCRGPVDGTERHCSVDGKSVWLHSECEWFFIRDRSQR